MRSTPFTARLLAATALGIVSMPATAADNGVTSTDSTLITNPSGITVTGDRKGVYSTGSALNLDNAGTIRGNGNAGSVNDADLLRRNLQTDHRRPGDQERRRQFR